MNNGVLIVTCEFDVYENMACDEVLCEIMPSKYILRFFSWKREGITFGFSQRYNNVVSMVSKDYNGWDITRRPTGGGIVIHKDDITFSFIFYSPDIFNPLKTYELLHTAIYEEYLSNGISLDIAQGVKSDYNINAPIMDCFRKPVDKDLLINGKKVLGGALRKFSDYILYQASLQFENARENFPFHSKIITNALSKAFMVEFEKFSINNEYYRRIEDKKVSKYISPQWIKRI